MEIDKSRVWFGIVSQEVEQKLPEWKTFRSRAVYLLAGYEFLKEMLLF